MFPEAVVGVLHIVFFLLPEARVDAFLLSVYGSDRSQTIRPEEAELQECSTIGGSTASFLLQRLQLLHRLHVLCYLMKSVSHPGYSRLR